MCGSLLLNEEVAHKSNTLLIGDYRHLGGYKRRMAWPEVHRLVEHGRYVDLNRSMAFALAYQLYTLAHTQQHVRDSICIWAGALPRAGALARAQLMKNCHG